MCFNRSKKEITALFVDDNHSVINWLKIFIPSILVNHHLQIDTFESYDEFSKNKRDFYDLVIVDWNLKNGNSSQIVSEIKNRFYTGIILASMMDEVKAISNFAIQNGMCFIPKGTQANKKLIDLLTMSDAVVA